MPPFAERSRWRTPLGMALALAVLAGCACRYAARDARTAPETAPWRALQAEPDLHARADQLQRADPVRIARSQHAAGRIVFAGVNGIAGNVPEGVELSRGERACYPVVPIDGTSDALIGDGGMRLQRVANEFASRYNAELLRLVRAR